jgi:hypothetical protein
MNIYLFFFFLLFPDSSSPGPSLLLSTNEDVDTLNFTSSDISVIDSNMWSWFGPSLFSGGSLLGGDAKNHENGIISQSSLLLYHFQNMLRMIKSCEGGSSGDGNKNALLINNHDYLSLLLSVTFIDGCCLLMKTLFEINVKKENENKDWLLKISNTSTGDITTKKLELPFPPSTIPFNYSEYTDFFTVCESFIEQLLIFTTDKYLHSPFYSLVLSVLSSLYNTLASFLQLSPPFSSSNISLLFVPSSITPSMYVKKKYSIFIQPILSKIINTSDIITSSSVFNIISECLIKSTYLPNYKTSCFCSSLSSSSSLLSNTPYTIHPALSSYYHNIYALPPLPHLLTTSSSSFSSSSSPFFSSFSSSSFPLLSSSSLSFLHSFLLLLLSLNNIDNCIPFYKSPSTDDDPFVNFLLLFFPFFVSFFYHHLSSLRPSPLSAIPFSSLPSFNMATPATTSVDDNDSNKKNFENDDLETNEYKVSPEKQVDSLSFIPYLKLENQEYLLKNCSFPSDTNSDIKLILSSSTSPSSSSSSPYDLPFFPLYPSRAVRSHRIISLSPFWHTAAALCLVCERWIISKEKENIKSGDVKNDNDGDGNAGGNDLFDWVKYVRIHGVVSCASLHFSSPSSLPCT